MTVTKRTFQFNGQIIEASIHRSNRVKTSEIIIGEDGVEIRTPMRKSISEIESIVKKKRNWIARKQSEYAKREYHIIRPTFEIDSTLPYLGKNIPVRIRASSEANDNIKLVDGEFHVSIFGKSSPAQIRRLYEQWIRKTAREILSHKVKQYSKLLNVEVKKVRNFINELV
jgi:predicted metal-dependent hydrolase